MKLKFGTRSKNKNGQINIQNQFIVSAIKKNKTV